MEFLGISLIYITSLSSAFADSTGTIFLSSVKTLLSRIPLGFDFNSKSCGFLSNIFKIVCVVSQSSSLELELPAQHWSLLLKCLGCYLRCVHYLHY